MKPSSKPLQITVYQDVLCAWCYLADLRLETLKHEFGDIVRWRVRPYPLRVHDKRPTEKELRGLTQEITLAQKEPEPTARLLSTELWREEIRRARASRRSRPWRRRTCRAPRRARTSRGPCRRRRWSRAST
ncbi:DsbA family oxidoreductase [Cystobacter fuscus]